MAKKSVSKEGIGKDVDPPNPVKTPPGSEGQNCGIVFGHNAEIKKVLMQFSVLAERLVFTPEEAEDVAAKLTYYAMLARGGKPS